MLRWSTLAVPIALQLTVTLPVTAQTPGDTLTEAGFPVVDYFQNEAPLARLERLARSDTRCANRTFQRPDSTALILMTGSPNGTYQAIGCAIARVIEGSSHRRVILVNSSGSRENLEYLARGLVDLAIAQGDAAHHAYTGEYRIRKRPGDDRCYLILHVGRCVRAIVGLHYEHVLAIATRGLNSLDSLDETSAVVIGAEGSGTIDNARDVLDQVAATPGYLIKEPSRAALGHLAPDGGVDLVFMTSAIDSPLLQRIQEVEATILPITEDVRGHLEKEHRYYREDADRSTLRIRALLLTRNSMPDRTVSGILEAIHRDIGTDASLIGRAHEAAVEIRDDSTLVRDVSVPIHRAAATIFCHEKGTACAYTRTFQLMAVSAVVLSMLGSILFGIAFVGPVRRVFLRFAPGIALADTFGPDGFVSQWRWLLIPVFALVVVLSGTLMVSLLEVWRSLSNGSTSAFTNRNFIGNVVWMLVFTASGYENQTFPVSLLGQVVSAGTVVVAVGGVLFLVGIVTSDNFARKMKMDLRGDPRRLNSHIIICGWNARAPAAVKALCGTGDGERQVSMVIVAELDFDPADLFASTDHHIMFVRGSPTRLANLEKAELARADTVIVLADDAAKPEDRDARTLLIASQAEKYVHRLVADGKRETEIHTVAELTDPDNREVFQASFIDQIICRSEFDEQLLAQSVMNPGFTKFMQEILTDADRNEIYEVPAAGRATTPFVGLNYDAALATGRRTGLLLLAIHRRGDGQPGSHSRNGTGDVLTNPTDPSDREYAIQPADSLLFLAPDRRSLESIFGSAIEWRRALLLS